MQNNQQSGNSQQGGQQKQYPSWSQPQKQSGNAKPAQPTLPAGTAAMASTTRVATFFILGLIFGWLITWSWFDLRAPKSVATNGGTTATSSLSTSQSKDTGLSITGTASSGTTASSDTPSKTSTGTSAAASAGTMTNDSITVPSPQQAGTEVAISNLTASSPVWVVVYEDNNGTVGRALGAHLVPKGQTSTSVSLLRSTLPNLNYYVGLVADTSSHTFSLHVNPAVLGTDGKQVMAKFTAQ